MNARKPISATVEPTAVSALLSHPGRGGCGVGAIIDFGGPNREVVEWGLAGIRNMEHRGGALGRSGDGAGLLIRTPRGFFEPYLAPGRRLSPTDHLSVGVIYFPPGEPENVPPTQKQIDAVLRRQGLAPLGWRRVPVADEPLGERARRSRKDSWQVLIGDGMVPEKELALALFKVKQRLEHRFRDLYVASFSPNTVLYKAMTTGTQFARYYPDLADPAFTTDVCVFHRRYSTNIVSNWYLAQPFRVIAHNGEMNAIRAARDAVHNLEGELNFPGLLMHQGSDSADLDRMTELLTAHGVPLLEALVRIVSPAWRDRPLSGEPIARWQDAVRRAMGSLVSWEGPAAIVGTDGTQVVGVLDRMGQLPLRYFFLSGRGRFVLTSEAGSVPLNPDEITESGHLGPGEGIAIDLGSRQIVRPKDVPAFIVEGSQLNHQELSERHLVSLTAAQADSEGRGGLEARHLVLYGWTKQRQEAAQFMAAEGREPPQGVATDHAFACFSQARPPLSRFFSQFLGVVTNPPSDPVREGGAVDLSVYLGRHPSISQDLPEYRAHPQYRLDAPFLATPQMQMLWRGGDDRPRAAALDATYPCPTEGDGDPKAIAARIRKLVRRGLRMVARKEASIIVLSDRRAAETLAPGTVPERLPLPMLLLASALHDALNEEGMRRRVGIVAESGEVQNAHDAAVLIANGVDAVCPWLFLRVCRACPEPRRGETATAGIAALNTGLARILSKMGVTTVQAYRGARLFEAVAVSPSLVDHYLPGTVSRLGGIGLTELHGDIVWRARAASEQDLTSVPEGQCDPIYEPQVWHTLQLAARGDDAAWGRFVAAVETARPAYLRDLLTFRIGAGEDGLDFAARAIGEEEVAPPEWIVATTFRAAAMAHGALHPLAHRAIAAAFNNFGARSNSGEGGEDSRRDRGGEWQQDRSRIRQVGAGRFGVEARYLVNADELEIKIGQGAKPGEGGKLRGEQVTAEIAAIRKSQEGVPLRPPPSNQDLFSIEDLAQLAYNLRQINPRATIGVKLPAVTDIGTIAVGVVKAGADVLTVSGCDGGSGAAAAFAVAHTGLPLERALAETHQALVINRIRDGVVLRAEGGIKTGLDILKLIALGANEVTLGAALMVAEQCVFCRGCAAGECPQGNKSVGGDNETRASMRPVMALCSSSSAEADPEQRYQEARRAVERYLLALAGDVRLRLARLGMRTPAELVGRVDLLVQVPTGDARIDTIDLSELLFDPLAFAEVNPEPQATGLRPRIDTHDLPGDRVAPSLLNRRILQAVRERLHVLKNNGCDDASGVEATFESSSQDRAAAATLAGEMASGRIHPPKGGIRLKLHGAAGQALGFGLVAGLTVELDGYANDTVGAAMSGGRIILRPPSSSSWDSSIGSPAIAGNAVGFGATGGELFIAGRCGQRLGVRCSGAVIVCEGAGKFAFEYMAGGVGVILGMTGGQVGTGMTDGIVYLLDIDNTAQSCVSEDVVVTPLDESDRDRLRRLLESFATATGSPAAHGALNALGGSAPRFLKVTASTL